MQTEIQSEYDRLRAAVMVRAVLARVARELGEDLGKEIDPATLLEKHVTQGLETELILRWREERRAGD